MTAARPAPFRSVRVGIDVGGTFTDLVLLDASTGVTVLHKLPSTPGSPHAAPIRGLAELLAKTGIDPARIDFVGLGTTVATNALLERKGARTGLITTRGFRDVLEIGRQRRPDVYDLFRAKPFPLVSRERRLEVDERVAGDGSVICEIDLSSVLSAVAELRALGIESVALCFLNAYANPLHEQKAAALLREHWPESALSISHELAPEFREYERLSTTVINAYLMPVMSGYLSRFAREVRELRIPNPPVVMSSGGGVFSPALAARRPVDTLYSGPSGGVSGAACVASLAGHANLITFDMGGTSTDVCTVRDGRPDDAYLRTIDGLPLKTPAIDIHTVGSGGGSIAWIDAGGLLRVGPRSAGADPGPACFMRGGTEPTVTDADVVLGRLNQASLLGGTLEIDPALSRKAIETRLARPRGTDSREAAAAVLAVSNSNIAQAIRYVSVERGLDPADFILVAFGGAGPLHAAEVAQELGMDVLVPPAPGVLCAMGVLTKDMQVDVSQTCIVRDSSPELDARIRSAFEALERRALASFHEGGVETAALAVERIIDIRYVGQNFELPVAVVPAAGWNDTGARVRAAFEACHERFYGYRKRDAELELVTFRIKASVPAARPNLAPASHPPRRVTLAPAASRDVYFESAGGFVRCPVFDRSALRAGDRLVGPAIVEQMDTTTVIPPGSSAAVDDYLNLSIACRGPQPAVRAAAKPEGD
jgi:N-methylhydantoinase A